jgi:GAF domain-containing protein
MATVPIVGSDRVLGLVNLQNHEREHAYGEADVRLMQTIAASMGMALENARLFNETQAALEKQTATSEILRAISRSPTSAAGVQAIAERAMGLCRASAASSSPSTATGSHGLQRRHLHCYPHAPPVAPSGPAFTR